MKRTILLLALVMMIGSCSALRIFSEAQSEYDQGMALFNRGKFEEAIPHFQKATDIDPEFAPAYLYLGKSYLSIRKWREAVPPLRTAYRLSPDKTTAEAFDLILDALMGAAVGKSP